MEKQEEEGIPWWQKLLAGLTAALGILGSIYGALRGIFSPLGSFFKKLVFKPVPKTPPPEEKPASEKDRESEREKDRENEENGKMKSPSKVINMGIRRFCRFLNQSNLCHCPLRFFYCNVAT